jgi:hypothetical protein
MSRSSSIYDFVFRGLLTEEALDKTERLVQIGLTNNVDKEVSKRLPIEAMDETMVSRAKRMATVYIAIAAFENTVREFVSKRLLEEKGADWWTTSVSEAIRKKVEARMEQEKKIKWHTARGATSISYTDFGDLGSIIHQNWTHFEDHLHSLEWAKQIFSTLELSRNVIMHSGDLGLQDVE